jgi:hemin uptake protein HemP
MDRPIEQEDRLEPSRLAMERVVEPGRSVERPAFSRDREAVPGRFRTFRVSDAERETLFDIGRFRTVAEVDLARFRYAGNSLQMEQDLRSLASQGLVQRRTAWIGRGHGKLDVLVLTRAGKELLDRARPPCSQALYAGFVKPSEVAHDAAIYRMFQAAGERIQQEGGTIRRVVLDYEFKEKVYSPLAKAKRLPPAEYAKRQAAVASENGLKVVRGTIPLPDLRIEFETRDREMARVDLELATHHYHASHLGTKAEAGFTLYVADGSASRLSRVLEEREITAVILSL